MFHARCETAPGGRDPDRAFSWEIKMCGGKDDAQTKIDKLMASMDRLSAAMERLSFTKEGEDSLKLDARSLFRGAGGGHGIAVDFAD